MHMGDRMAARDAPYALHGGAAFRGIVRSKRGAKCPAGLWRWRRVCMVFGGALTSKPRSLRRVGLDTPHGAIGGTILQLFYIIPLE